MNIHFAYPKVVGAGVRYSCACGFVSIGADVVRLGARGVAHSTALRVFAPDGKVTTRDDCCRCGPPNPPPCLPCVPC